MALSGSRLISVVILFIARWACLHINLLRSVDGLQDYNANYRLDEMIMPPCFNESGTTCACMSTHPAPKGATDQRRVITDVICRDCQRKICLQHPCKGSFSFTTCNIYNGCIRLCLCRCPGTRFGSKGQAHVYIPCDRWCNGNADCPYGLDEPKGVLCAKHSKLSAVIPVSVIGLVALLILLCWKSIARTINSVLRRICGREVFATRAMSPRAQQMMALGAHEESTSVHHDVPASQHPLMTTPQPTYPFDLLGYHHTGPQLPPPSSMNIAAHMPPPPPYESIVGSRSATDPVGGNQDKP